MHLKNRFESVFPKTKSTLSDGHLLYRLAQNTKFPKITIKRKTITMGNKFINLQPLYVFKDFASWIDSFSRGDTKSVCWSTSSVTLTADWF